MQRESSRSKLNHQQHGLDERSRGAVRRHRGAWQPWMGMVQHAKVRQRKLITGECNNVMREFRYMKSAEKLTIPTAEEKRRGATFDPSSRGFSGPFRTGWPHPVFQVGLSQLLDTKLTFNCSSSRTSCSGRSPPPVSTSGSWRARKTSAPAIPAR